MKNLIVFATKHGCAETYSQKLKQKFREETLVLNLKNSGHINLNDFNTIVVGGSIHAGRIQKRVIKFCSENMEILLKKKLGLFICCMEQGEKAEKQFDEAFPQNLRNHASAAGLFGGEFNFEEMNFIERFIIKKIAKVEKSVSKISEENIALFADQLT